jgi:hypothetical protein
VRRLAAAGGVAVLILLAVATPAHAEAAPDSRVSRVLLVALPNVEWADIQGADLPNLHRLFTHSAIGALITNGVVRPSPIGSNYVTLGAGTRATANAQTAGQGFGIDEDFGRDRAGRVFTTRTGTLPGRGLVYMPIKDVIDDNDSELFGAEVGLLGDELARAHIARGVIANGDGSDPSAPEDRVPPYRRSAVAALTTHAGRVPRGRVDRGLLTLDASAPFGVRLDTSAVLAAFRRAWTAQSVVLVEGSDLVRADLAGRFASDDQRDRMRARALRDTDRMVGRLLDSVDTRHDAVMVVGPAPPQDRPGLTPISLRAPGVTSGMLRSSTTRHNGFVNMVDVAPTVLRLFGIDRPDAMEGRRMTAEDVGGSADARVASLVNANEDGLFRDRQVGAALVVVIVIASVLAVATALVDRFRRGAWALAFVALGLIGFLDATYLAGPFHFGRHGGVAPYWAFVGGVAVILAAAFFFAPRLVGTAPRSTRLVYSLLVALGSIVVLHVLDLVTGAHLEWNTVFGYSPTVGIRLVGEGNMAFAQLSVAALLFAGLIAWQVPPPRGTRIAIGVLTVSIVVMGVPIWGNDFGAVVSALPGFALLAWMLLGHQIRVRTIAIVTGIVAAAVVVVGLLDLLRPSDQRTHVGRFLQKVGTDFGGATLVIRRKASENLSVFGRSVLLGTLIVIAVMVVYLWFVPPRSLRPVARAIPTARATVISLLVLAVLGFALNDSGIAIPGMMFVVVESTLVVLMAWSYVGRVPAGER